MNLLLFDDAESHRTLFASDGRVAHLRDVLRMSVGDRFDVGVVGGARGKATIVSDDERGMKLAIEWGDVPAGPMRLRLLVGLPRPQTARKVLRECTSIGVAGIGFFASSKGESSYRASKLWTTDEWRRQLREGAEQAFTTHLPTVEHFDSLAAAVVAVCVDGDPCERIALDVYEATVGLGEVVRGWGDHGIGASLSSAGGSSDIRTTAQAEACGSGVVLAVGPERGWSPAERDVLRGAGFVMAHLGERVLRTETACVAAVSMIAGGRGWL